MGKLGPVSRDILALVNDVDGYVNVHKIKVILNNHRNLSHSEHWYRARLIALAFEGHIKGTTFRVGDRIFLRFKRLPKANDDNIIFIPIDVLIGVAPEKEAEG